MSTAVQLRRGTTAQHAGFTGAVGEVTVDTDKDVVVVHDGALAGGYPMAKEAAIGARKASAVAGTVDAITATFSPAFASLAASAGYVLAIPLAGANTSTTPSLAIDGLAAKTIVKGSGVALAAGDIPGADFVGLFVYDASLDKFQLINPYQASSATATQIFSLTAAVGSNALTISANILNLDFRSTTLGDGTVTQLSGDPADLVISSGSTLGTTNGVKSRIAVLAINNAGAIELAAVNLAGGVDLSETGLITTTAEGGAGAADSATTIYSTTARANVAYRVIGYIESTQATAGLWATAPSLVQGSGGRALAQSSTVFVKQITDSTDITLNDIATSYNNFGAAFDAVIPASGYLQISVNGRLQSTVAASGELYLGLRIDGVNYWFGQWSRVYGGVLSQMKSSLIYANATAINDYMETFGHAGTSSNGGAFQAIDIQKNGLPSGSKSIQIVASRGVTACALRGATVVSKATLTISEAN